MHARWPLEYLPPCWDSSSALQPVARHNHPEDDAASRAYLASTGRWAQEIAQVNRGWKAPPDSDAELWQADGTDSGEASLSTAGYRAGSLSA